MHCAVIIILKNKLDILSVLYMIDMRGVVSYTKDKSHV